MVLSLPAASIAWKTVSTANRSSANRRCCSLSSSCTRSSRSASSSFFDGVPSGGSQEKSRTENLPSKGTRWRFKISDGAPLTAGRPRCARTTTRPAPISANTEPLASVSSQPTRSIISPMTGARSPAAFAPVLMTPYAVEACGPPEIGRCGSKGAFRELLESETQRKQADGHVRVDRIDAHEQEHRNVNASAVIAGHLQPRRPPYRWHRRSQMRPPMAVIAAPVANGSTYRKPLSSNEKPRSSTR